MIEVLYDGPVFETSPVFPHNLAVISPLVALKPTRRSCSFERKEKSFAQLASLCRNRLRPKAYIIDVEH